MWHLDDVAADHLLAFDKGRIGERTIFGIQAIDLGTMLTDIARLAGRRPPLTKLPSGPLFPLGAAAELVARFTGKEPFATVDALRMAKYRMFFSSAKAEGELGYRARTYGEALADAVAWFRGAGMIG